MVIFIIKKLVGPGENTEFLGVFFYFFVANFFQFTIEVITVAFVTFPRK